MVHIKIHDGYALQAVALQRIPRGNGHVVEKTKAHGLVAAGMVAWRSDGAKSVIDFARHHCIHRCQGRARSAQRRIPGVDIEGRIGVHLGVRGPTGIDLLAQHIGQSTNGGHIHAPMGQFDIGYRRLWRLAALQQTRQGAVLQPRFNGAEAFGALGMALAHLVFPAIGVGKVPGLVQLNTHRHNFSGKVPPWTHNTHSKPCWPSLTR